MSGQHTPVLVRAYGMTDVGMVRKNNEDSYLIADLETEAMLESSLAEPRPVGEKGVLLAVSDGMGGAAAGEIASAITVESLKHWLHEDHRGLGTRELIQEAVEDANRHVYEAAQEVSKAGMGATLTAVMIRGSIAHIAEVGDSRAYLLRAGRLRQVTRDQSFVQLLIEQGLITRDQAEKSPYRNVILQAMGQKPHVEVALGRLELRRGDVFILCSDGLSGKVSDAELQDIVSGSDSFDVACRTLVERANQNGGEDNITVVLAEIGGDGVPEPKHDERITRALDSIQEFGDNAPTALKNTAVDSPAAAAAPAPALVPAVASAPASVIEPVAAPTAVLTPDDPALITQVLSSDDLPPFPDEATAAATAETAGAEGSSNRWIWIAILVALFVVAGGFALLFVVIPRLR